MKKMDAKKIWIFCMILKVTGGLEMLGIDAPSFINSNQTAELVCKYSIGKDSIYSIKWYKDNHEMWRYMPSDSPPVKTFPVDGITVLNTTRPNKMIFQAHGPKGSGVYKCEISIEAPSFYTDFSVTNVTVVVPPVGTPEISGGEEYYRDGSAMELNCSLRNSLPAATLTWKLNNLEVPSHYNVGRRTMQEDNSGLYTSVLGLRFITDRRDFPGGIAKVTCEADIGEGVYLTEKSQSFSGGGRAMFSGSNPVAVINWQSQRKIISIGILSSLLWFRELVTTI